MKRIIAIIISICLFIAPINIYAVTAEDDSIGVKENSISTPSTKRNPPLPVMYFYKHLMLTTINSGSL